MFGVEVLDRHHCFNKAKNNNRVPVVSPSFKTLHCIRAHPEIQVNQRNHVLVLPA